MLRTFSLALQLDPQPLEVRASGLLRQPVRPVVFFRIASVPIVHMVLFSRLTQHAALDDEEDEEKFLLFDLLTTT